MDKRITEQPSHYDHLEQMSVEQITANINRENMSVPMAVDKALPAINRLIDAVEHKLRCGGRLFYVGCGTGGRLATLDTIEVQNTYGIDGRQIQAIFPGGIECLTQTRERARTTPTTAGRSSRQGESARRTSWWASRQAAPRHLCWLRCDTHVPRASLQDAS